MECVYQLINLIIVRPLCMLNALVGWVTFGVYKNDSLKLSNLPVTLCCLRAVLYDMSSKPKKWLCGRAWRFIATLLHFTKREKETQLDIQRWRQQELMWVTEFQVVVVTIKCRLHYLLTLLLYQILYGLKYSTVNQCFVLGTRKCGYVFFHKYRVVSIIRLHDRTCLYGEGRRIF